MTFEDTVAMGPARTSQGGVSAPHARDLGAHDKQLSARHSLGSML